MTGRPSVKEFVFQSLPGTRKEIELRSGVSSSSVGYWLSTLRAKGEIHVESWRRSQGGGSLQPIFVSGAGEDAKKPKAFTEKENSKRHRVLTKKDGRLEERNARRRARYHEGRAKLKQNDWLGALR